MLPRLLLFLYLQVRGKNSYNQRMARDRRGLRQKNGLIMKIDLNWGARSRFARVCSDFEKGVDELECIVTAALATDEPSCRQRLVDELRTRMERQEKLLAELGELHSEDDEATLWLCRNRHEVIGAAVFRLEEM